MILLDLSTFTGRLHPLIVHLPLGFLLLAVMFNLAGYYRKFDYLAQAVPFTLFAGFISATLACFSGYLLSLSGDYDHSILRQHKISGITLAAVSGLLFLFTLPKFSFIPRKIFSFCLAALIALLSFTGHQGGNLTHGSDFLSLKTLTKQKRPRPARIEDAFIFEDIIHPILEKKCATCHEGNKLKGRLSVETLASLFKGGKHGPAIVAGKPLESELYQRITLDPKDEKFMPSDGKTPLKKSEVEILRWWIEQGAVEEKKFVAMDSKIAVTPKIMAFLGLGEGEEDGDNDTDQSLNPDIPISFDKGSVENLRQKGWMIRVMLQKPGMLDVTMPPGSGARIEDSREDLSKLSRNIIWLNLSNNQLSDQELEPISQFSNVEKLKLNNNPLSDKICNQLISLKHLQAVNLNDTRISEEGIAQLNKNPSIQRIYHWSSPVKK
ncbi:MAG: c-type cytochrome domain-containing protein [Flavitalea sp.]